jgi:hypothetical protein
MDIWSRRALDVGLRETVELKNLFTVLAAATVFEELNPNPTKTHIIMIFLKFRSSTPSSAAAAIYDRVHRPAGAHVQRRYDLLIRH